MKNGSPVRTVLLRLAMLMSLMAAVGAVQEVSAAEEANTPPETIRIATFNIKTFGPKKAGKADVMAVLADIVRKYDIVAVQEMKDRNRRVPKLFLKAINAGGLTYGVLASERSGLQEDDKHLREIYAYYYRTSTIDVLDKGALYDDSGRDHFQREPFVARFVAKSGNFTFAMINVHTPPARAVEEIGTLHHVVEWSRKRYPDEDDFIVLGDFNAGCTYANEDELRGLEISGADYVWIIPNSADTNLGELACAYDRIVIDKRGIEDYTGAWGVDQAFEDEKISDHWPVWAEFHVNKDGGR